MKDAEKASMILNEFAATCMREAEGQLRSEGTVKGTVIFGYGMQGEPVEAEIATYELTQQDTEESENELLRIRGHAVKTRADAVALIADMAHDDMSLPLFPGNDGFLIVTAASHENRAMIMRPYKRSPDGITFADPKIVTNFPNPLLDSIFPPDEKK